MKKEILIESLKDFHTEIKSGCKLYIKYDSYIEEIENIQSYNISDLCFLEKTLKNIGKEKNLCFFLKKKEY